MNVVYGIVLSLLIIMSLSAVARSNAINTNSQNSSFVRQACVPNISKNKCQSCIQEQCERSPIIYNINYIFSISIYLFIDVNDHNVKTYT